MKTRLGVSCENAASALPQCACAAMLRAITRHKTRFLANPAPRAAYFSTIARMTRTDDAKTQDLRAHLMSNTLR